MSESASPVVLVVRAPTCPRREGEIRRWIRALVPTALILVSSVPLDLDPRAVDDVVTLTSEDVDAGPLAIAAALARPRAARE
jgi:hypothetical protein